MSTATPTSSSEPSVRSQWREWSLIVGLLVVLFVAATLPLQGLPDLVIRPLMVIALLLFVGTRIDQRGQAARRTSSLILVHRKEGRP